MKAHHVVSDIIDKVEQLPLRQQPLYHLAMHIGEAEVSALKAVREPRVVKAQEVEDRRVQVVHVDRVLDDVEAQVVGSPPNKAALDPAAGHPDGERAVVVVAAVVPALHHGRAAKLAAPDDERLVQEAAALQVLHQGGACLVCVPTVFCQGVFEVALLVPSLVKELN